MAQAIQSRKPLNAIQRFASLPEHVMADVIDDVLYVSKPPTISHQRVVMQIMLGLYTYNERLGIGEVYPIETGVYIDRKNVVQPDLLFFFRNNPRIRARRKGIYGAPDLLIEVLSPSTRKKDRFLKKDLYARNGVREYWIIDPDTKRAYGYLLENKKYDEPLQLRSKIYVRILNETFKF